MLIPRRSTVRLSIVADCQIPSSVVSAWPWPAAPPLARLSDVDLRALVHADAVTARIEALHRQPALLLDALDRPSTSAAVLNLARAATSGAQPGLGRAHRPLRPDLTVPAVRARSG